MSHADANSKAVEKGFLLALPDLADGSIRNLGPDLSDSEQTRTNDTGKSSRQLLAMQRFCHIPTQYEASGCLKAVHIQYGSSFALQAARCICSTLLTPVVQ